MEELGRVSGNLAVAAVLITWLVLAARTRTWPFERAHEDCECEEPEDEGPDPLAVTWPPAEPKEAPTWPPAPTPAQEAMNRRNPATPDPRHDRQEP